MPLTYGYLKCKVVSDPELRGSQHRHETQYHLHTTAQVGQGGGGTQAWDTAVNVGTDDAHDLLQYRLVADFGHAILTALRAAASGFTDLTRTAALPALDFLRSDVLAGTGSWKSSDQMDGSAQREPAASLAALLTRARAEAADVYFFGRTYVTGGPGIHDIHMNQGSTSQSFWNNGQDDHNDHNAVWQDGAILVDFGPAGVSGYFTAFSQQMVPTDDLGNPVRDDHPVQDSDAGSLAG